LNKARGQALLALVLVVVLALGAWPSVALGTPATGAIRVDLPMAASPDLSLPMEEALSLPGYDLNARPGEPRLPVRTLQVLLPSVADLGSVAVSFEASGSADLGGSIFVPPAGPLISSDEMAQENWNGLQADDLAEGGLRAIYEADAFWPSDPVTIESIGEQRGYRVVTLSYWPLSYNPVQGTLRQSADASALVTFSQELRSVIQADAAERVAWDMLAPQLVNAEDRTAFYPQAPLAGGRGTLPDGPEAAATNDYVIITTASIRDGSAQLAAFVANKQANGYTVKVVTEGAADTATTYLSGSTADARANNIRSWLQAHYAAEGILYVLLVGNPDPTAFSSATSVPMKLTNPYQSTPTDMFYSDLSGTWDLNGNGTYGELTDIGTGGIDRLPEVTVGRIPFYGTFADLDAILARSVAYASATGDLSWRQRAIIAAAISNHGPQDNNNDGTADYQLSQRTYGDDWGEAVKSMLAEASLDAYTLYEKSGIYGDGSAYPLTLTNAALSTANMISAWNQGYGLVTWWGHGNYMGAYRRVWVNDSTRADRITQYSQETSSPTFLSSGDTYQLSNDRPSFVVQVACLNGQPERLDNLGYRLLVNGSVGTISSSRLSWYMTGAWTPKTGAGWADNASIGYRVSERLAANGDAIGDALAYFRAYSALYSTGGFWMNLLGANLYGDPSLSLSSMGSSDPCAVAPYTPTSPSPADAAQAVSVDSALSWTGGHTCLSETVTYEVYLGTGGSASTLVCSGSDTTCNPGGLIGGETYTWQVVATSAAGSTTGPLWQFTTDQLPCTVPPTVPYDPTPADDATGVAVDVTLSWCGGHTCPGEDVTYDVYLRTGGSGSGTRVCTNLSSASCYPGELVEATVYEWQVVSVGLNGPTAGPWWSFTTLSCPLPAAVSLVAPLAATTFGYNEEPELAWQTVANASYYEVEIYSDASLSSLAMDTTTVRTSMRLASHAPAGDYFWRVRAVCTESGCTSEGPWSTVGSFKVEAQQFDYHLMMPITFRP